jgi:arylsulfatase A-like enzyme
MKKPVYRQQLTGLFVAVAVFSVFSCQGLRNKDSLGESKGEYNVLFIVVDDLRPMLGCYGDPHAKTPHLDALAADGIVFNRAYCETPQCLPSRTSTLTGLRAESTGIFSNRDGHFRDHIPAHVTLPQHFKNNGYFCMEFGKVFHHQDSVSYSVPKFLPKSSYAYPIYGKPESEVLQRSLPVVEKGDEWWGYLEERNTRWIRGLSWEDPDVPDSILFDGQMATAVIKALRKYQDERFFFAPGFFRPHLPFIAPKNYYDLYPIADLKLPENQDPPTHSPEFADNNMSESRSYYDVPRDGNIEEQKQLELLRGYYASVSYVDAQIGKVLKELDRLHLREKTIIVLWSDHGYHFGEHRSWGKNTNFEEATRATLIINHPGMKIKGMHTDGFVELVDLYPTLCELCQLKLPEGLEGTSFVPLLNNPDQPWKKAIFCRAKPKGTQGYTMRTPLYRYTEWRDDEGIIATEIYDHINDPQENINIAGQSEFRELSRKLKAQFDRGWQAAQPRELSK